MEVVRWNFINAWPTKWDGPHLNAKGNEIAVETLVLAHEGEHARQRDPLIVALALLNRAVFWFHPLAWWLESRV